MDMIGFHITKDIQISAISAEKMFADSRYADIEKKCRYADIADIADADINTGTSLVFLCLTDTVAFLVYFSNSLSYENICMTSLQFVTFKEMNISYNP